MREKEKRVFVIVIFIVAIGNILMPSSGTLRLAVFAISPRSAFTMEYKYIDTEPDGEEIYRITKNPPIEKATQGELTTWAVCRIGPFKYARYYGEC